MVPKLMNSRTYNAAIPALLFLGSLNLFVWRLESPYIAYFDEVHYVPAARQILQHGVNTNWSHPNLGKFLIALGIRLLGDHAGGWRIMSAMAGALTVLCAYWIGHTLFRTRRAAVQCALVGVLNQIIFVQARLATLDMIATAFMMVAIGIFAQVWCDRALSERQVLSRMTLAGVMLGAATATKWIGVIPILTISGLYLLRSAQGRARRAVQIAAFGCLEAGTYILALLPSLGMRHPGYAPALPAESGGQTAYGLKALAELQWEMLMRQLHFYVPHRYVSAWYGWPFSARPTWYYLDTGLSEFTQKVSGVALIGNPAVFWTGFGAALFSLALAIRKKERTAIFLSAFYFSLLCFWALVPGHSTFLYYYLPASVFLGPLLVLFFREARVSAKLQALFWIAAVGCFIYFYPVLANWPLSERGLVSRIWFRGWGI